MSTCDCIWRVGGKWSETEQQGVRRPWVMRYGEQLPRERRAFGVKPHMSRAGGQTSFS